MNAAAPVRDETWRAFAWFALIAAVFLLAHPYKGVIHDNILYVAQALSWLNPDIFRGDVYFQWGSQDRYTFFSPIYGTLIRHFGLGPANMTLVLISMGLFLGASFALVRVLLPAGLRGFAMLFIACSTGLYGGLGDLRIVETFVTPRLPAQAATLLSMLFLVSGHRNWSLAVLAVSAMLHPLFALAGMLYWWLYHLVEDRRWWWLVALGVIPAGAGLAGIAPFSQLLQSFDPAWLEPIQRENPALFLVKWKSADGAQLLFDLVILYAGVQLAADPFRRAIKAAIGTAIAALGITLAGADLLQNVLLTNIQLWRALWIVHWIALAALPLVVARLWSAGASGRLLAGLAIFGFVSRGLTMSIAASVLTAALFLYRDRIAPRDRLLQLSLGALAAGGFINWLVGVVKVRDYAFDAVDLDVATLLGALSLPLPLLGIAAALVWLGLAQRRDPRPAVIVVLCALAFAISVWDRRTPLGVHIESAPLGSHPFSGIVAPDKQVLWNWDLTSVWILMQRRSYFTSYQHAGQMFNRDTAMELRRRRQIVILLRRAESRCAIINRVQKGGELCRVEEEAFRDVCRNALDLDYIVSETSLPNKWLASWTPPVAIAGFRPHHYLYDCKSLARN